jgi:cyclopropane-fatty-acyl-phospholipid synthase
MLTADIARIVLTSARVRFIDWRGASHEAGPEGAPLAGVIAIKTPQTDRRIARDPQAGVGEAFVDGDLEVVEGDLVDVLAAALRDTNAGHAPKSMKWRANLLSFIRALQQLNTPTSARKHIAHHYDLDYDFYALWLDKESHYSCAFFGDPQMTLEQAQMEKARRIAVKLMLRPGDRVLDIGCGWGALSIYLARNFDVRVTGITLSREQLAVAQRRAKEAGLADRVSFELCDYREHKGVYERIVSVGMLEHVGAPHLPAYFRVVGERLTEDGVALIHTIGRVGPPAATNSWIRKYIFPGGFIPSLSEIASAVERRRLISADVETLRLHYAFTLREWRKRFLANRDAIKERYGERFCRMWEFYLIISEASFLSGVHVNYQLQLCRDLQALPLSRDYLYETADEAARKAASRTSSVQAAALREALSKARTA